MRKLGHHSPSFLKLQTMNQEPYLNWFNLAKSKEEQLRLIDSLSVIPINWIQWVDDKISNYTYIRGISIKHPLNYRLSLLWRSIVLFQECKYICDNVENCLKIATYITINTKGLKYNEIGFAIPGGNPKIAKLLNQNSPNTSMDNAVSWEFIKDLHFGDITTFMCVSWSSLLLGKSIRNLFVSSQYCRNKSIFETDMKYIKDRRNRIAHMQALFDNNEASLLLKKADQWLLPLGCKLSNKISQYRERRPHYLREIYK